MHEHNLDRPALRPVRAAEYPPGRKRLQPRWWALPDIAPGTCVLAREEHRQRRAARRPKHAPDVVAQKSERSWRRWLFEFEPEGLEWISAARH
jgi:hypothetical protein